MFRDCKTSCRLTVGLTSPDGQGNELDPRVPQTNGAVPKRGLKTPNMMQILLQIDCWFDVSKLTRETPAQLLVQIAGSAT